MTSLFLGKYQPDHIFLRHVQTSRVHMFTGVQILCMIGMWFVKSTKQIAILFPVMVKSKKYLQKPCKCALKQVMPYYVLAGCSLHRSQVF